MQAINTPELNRHRSRRSRSISAINHTDLLRNKISETMGCIAAFFLILNFLLGSIAALIFIMAASIGFLSNFKLSFSSIRICIPLLVLPILAMFSTIWSDAPSTTLRAALQLILTFCFAASIAGTCSSRNMIMSLMLGYFCVCSTAFPSIGSSFLTNIPLQGNFESKNAFAIYSQMLSLVALVFSFDQTRHFVFRILGFLVCILAILMTVLSKSEGAILISFVAIFIFLLSMTFQKLSKRFRIAALVLGVMSLVLIAPFASEFEKLVSILNENVLHKDSTLTGRTELWHTARQISDSNPMLGMGYQSFWRVGNPDAESIWREFGIRNRSGFNFHNEFFENLVSLGTVGFYLTIITWVYLASTAVYLILFRPTLLNCFFLSIVLVLFSRSFAEVSIFNPFSLNAFILVYCCVASVREKSGRPHDGHPSSSMPRRTG